MLNFLRSACALRHLTLCLVLSFPALAHAQPIFRNGLEDLDLLPLFPVTDGTFVLPDEPAANQLTWLLGELAKPSTSLDDINAHFSDAWLASVDAEATRDFIDLVRADFPNGKIIDIITLTPMVVNVFVQGQDLAEKTGFFTLKASYSGAQKITSLGVTPHSGELQYGEDQALTIPQAIAKFTTLAADTSVLVAWVDEAGACHPIHAHDANLLRATGSVFKTWVLGGLAERVKAGQLDPAQDVAFVASERVFAGSEINSEPFGTLFTLGDLATLMIGVSDNSATDLVHEVTGRSHIDSYVAGSGVADPDVLRPMLSVNEQFHLIFSFDLPTATGYVNDTEANQLTFINDQIVPLGPVSAFPYANDSLMTSGTWRASALDVCANYSRLRQYARGTPARELVDRAMGASVAQVGVRNHWDRAWYKGGSLVSGATGYHVLAHAWLLEDNGRPPFVVVAMANDSSGGIEDADGLFKVQSLLSRILEVVAESPY